MKKCINKLVGFTLIELIITIAILSVVIVSVAQFFVFNLNVYSKGEDLARVQFDVRMASDFIINELRNVTNISETAIASGTSIDLAQLQVNYPLVSSVSFKLIIENNRALVNYSVSGNSSDGKNPYNLESKILLNNDGLFKTGMVLTGNTLTSIYYKK